MDNPTGPDNLGGWPSHVTGAMSLLSGPFTW